MDDPAPLGIDIRKLAMGCVVAAATLGLLVVGRTFLIPLAIALLIWSLLDAVGNVFKRLSSKSRPMPQWLATTLAIVTLLALDVAAYSVLAEQEEALTQAAPVYQANLEQLQADVAAALHIERTALADAITKHLDIGALIAWVGGSASSLLGNLLLVLIYLGFLLAEQKSIPEKLARLQPDAAKATQLHQLVLNITRSIQRYLVIKTAVSILTGLVSYLVLRVMGVDFAAVWALLIFALNYIPNIGSILGVVFPALLTLVQFDTLTPFLVVVLGLGSAQFVIGNIVEPAWMGRSLNLSSFMIILALTFWGLVWGSRGCFCRCR